jgi:hypothetical protein
MMKLTMSGVRGIGCLPCFLFNPVFGTEISRVNGYVTPMRLHSCQLPRVSINLLGDSKY